MLAKHAARADAVITPVGQCIRPGVQKGFQVSIVSARSRRTGAVLGVAGLAALAFTGVATTASAAAPANAPGSTTNPYSPAYGHPYRHGVLPTIGTLQKMRNYAATHPNVTTATGPDTLSYGGGVRGVGVQSGHSKVYLVFYGNQWGTSSTDANGNLKFTGDSDGAAGVAQQMFKGIGTNNELWSADLTQWCDGNVATGATACPASGASYIPYQSGGVLAGVWYDNSGASPSAATSTQLSQEAVNAAGHFGNTTAFSNRYAYYVILSPHGTDPDNYQENHFCAWHNWTSSSYGDIAYSNQPYNMEYGGSGGGCGVGFVNSPGTTDGYTITLGHEWHEMMSDQNPYGGWSNHTGSSYNGLETSDECAWISPGQPGGVANVSFGSYGTYAEQASWSNDTNNCAISHPIVNHGTRVTLTAGQELTGGQALVNGAMAFNLGTDGNLVLTDNGHAVWANGMNHPGAYLIMQSDGNLVEYSGSTPVWVTGTYNHPGSILTLSSMGVTSVLNGNTTLWSTPYPNSYLASSQQDVLFGGQTLGAPGQTMYDASYKYSFYEYEGWLEMYLNGTNTLLWYAGSYCSGTNSADMQTDGNLVIYCNGQATWSSGTGGHPSSYGYWLHLQSDGNLVIYSNYGQAEWATGAH